MFCNIQIFYFNYHLAASRNIHFEILQIKYILQSQKQRKKQNKKNRKDEINKYVLTEIRISWSIIYVRMGMKTAYHISLLCLQMGVRKSSVDKPPFGTRLHI